MTTTSHDITYSIGKENPTHAMGTQYGYLQEFETEMDSIKGNLERVSLYYVANELHDDKNVPIKLSFISVST